MDEIDIYIEDKVNSDVEERNSPYLNFADSNMDSETENLNGHLSNLGDHHISLPPNNDFTHEHLNLPGYVNSTNVSLSIDESEEENDIDKYIEDKNNESKKHLKEDLPEYFYFLDDQKK